jgi:electron-transferring-flavoprotein dehydrogenase
MTVERPRMDVDIACVGFGPAMGGFLTTLSRAMSDPENQAVLTSSTMEGMPLQVVCYERADDISFGVSGVATKARGLRQSLPDLDASQIPMAHDITVEKMVYLLDPVGASRRGKALKTLDTVIGSFRNERQNRDRAVELPYIPEFLRKEEGLILSIGQFNQWVGSQLMGSGQVQLWPGMPVSHPLIESDRVIGIRLIDQGTDRRGDPDAGYTPGMDIHAPLTVIGDGPVGPVGRQIDEHFGFPESHHQREWAVGMKMVVDLPEKCTLEAGTVIHTLGYPEPEIFGFLYVHPDHVASLGIFVPSWLDSPVRTSYRYLQYWMMHPHMWRHLEGGKMRSWGAKTLQESGRRGEPHLVGNGFARIGEGSGSTNVLTGSGVDEAWTTGVQLGEGVIELLEQKRPFTKEHLEETYVQRRRNSWVEREGRIAERARDGFQKGFLTGLIGMGLAGLSNGKINLNIPSNRPYERVPTLEEYFRGRVPPEDIRRIREESAAAGTSLHYSLMERAGWPEIPYDGKLLGSHQDALLMGGKVQAPPGYSDHIAFLYPHLCERCDNKLCIEICSGQAILPGDDGGVPQFDREKCIHCGACIWSCALPGEDDPERGNVKFSAGAGGLHSGEN